ncbi:MAG: hypothetical protein IKB86_07060 [Clostridia bacterium]|nr:hypothetical protein [Clostridia bacterium]
MVTCDIITTTVKIEDRSFTVYGLELFADNKTRILRRIEDISDSFDFVDKLKEEINNSFVAENHIDDVLEDVLP